MKPRTERKIYKWSLVIWGVVFMVALINAKELTKYLDPKLVVMFLFLFGSLSVLINKWDKKIKEKEKKLSDAYDVFFEKLKKEKLEKDPDFFHRPYKSEPWDTKSVDEWYDEVLDKWKKELKKRPEIPQ